MPILWQKRMLIEIIRFSERKIRAVNHTRVRQIWQLPEPSFIGYVFKGPAGWVQTKKKAASIGCGPFCFVMTQAS
jgi:hypothetical protein